MAVERPVLRIEKNAFTTKADVYRDMIDSGFWPTTYFSSPSPELPLHWHDTDIVGYVMEGETYLLDEQGERRQLEQGDKLIIPAGALHAEGKVTTPVTYIVTTKAARPLLDALRMLNPASYPEPTALELDPALLAALAGAR